MTTSQPKPLTDEEYRAFLEAPVDAYTVLTAWPRLLATITELKKLVSDQGRVYHDSQWRQLKEAQADNARLRKALENIRGGCFPGASTLAINGDWQSMYNQLQFVAKCALAEPLQPQPVKP